MKIFLKIISVFFALGIIGNFLDGEFSPLVIIIALVTGYFGWFTNEDTKKERVYQKSSSPQKEVYHFPNDITPSSKSNNQRKKTLNELYSDGYFEKADVTSSFRERVQYLCVILNTAGINNKQKTDFFKDGKIHEWECDDDPIDVFGGEIACDSVAFAYLKHKGYIDIGVCWMCGNEPIKNDYIFTDHFDPDIKYSICYNCYLKGKRN